MLRLVLTPGGVAMLISFLFAAAAGAMMLGLYVRRRAYERRISLERQDDSAISRRLLHLIHQPEFDRSSVQLDELAPGQAHRIFSHLLRLVRGQDHDRLLLLADWVGLPDMSIRAMKHSLAARRVDAMRLLEQFPVARAIEALLDQMGHDPVPAVRLEAAAALARTGNLPCPRHIIEMLDLKSKLANRLHEAIFRSSASAFADELAQVSRDKSLGPVRPLLVEAIGWSEDYSLLPVLALHASDLDPEIRAAALKAARKLGHPSVSPWVRMLLLDPAEQVRIQAARTAGALGLRDAIPVLSTLVENPSWWVRTRAVEALSLLRPDQPAIAAGGGRKHDF